MQIHCLSHDMVDPAKLKPNPKNPQRHSVEQGRLLGKLFEHHGIRHPIIVSKRSGYIVAGHGRHMAALMAELKEFPVVYQDFESEEAEYCFMVSDNASQQDWAELDRAAINLELPDLGPMDLELLGLKDFKVATEELPPKPPPKECPNCGVVLK